MVPATGYTKSGNVAKSIEQFIARDANAKEAVYDITRSGGFSFEPDGVGYDVGIRQGWSIDDDGEHLHTLIRRTAAEVIAVLKTLERCDCR